MRSSERYARSVLSVLVLFAGAVSAHDPLVIAHRGASGYLPEHTLAAYELAIEQGADVIEPDLVFTRDGVLVARHDRYLSTTTDVADRPEFSSRRRMEGLRRDWFVDDFTLAELKMLRARQSFEGRGTEADGLHEIPTLQEVRPPQAGSGVGQRWSLSRDQEPRAFPRRGLRLCDGARGCPRSQRPAESFDTGHCAVVRSGRAT